MTIFRKHLMNGTNILCKIYNLYKRRKKAGYLQGQLFYFQKTLIWLSVKYFYSNRVIKLKTFRNHTGHIWGSSQRAWMREHTELERGRSKNQYLFYNKRYEKIKILKQKTWRYRKTMNGVLHKMVNGVNFRLTKIINNRLVRDELG